MIDGEKHSNGKKLKTERNISELDTQIQKAKQTTSTIMSRMEKFISDGNHTQDPD